MINQRENKFFRFVSSNGLIYFLVSLIFCFVWSDLLIDDGQLLPFWLLILGGLIIPFVLLISVVQYKSQIAYSITLSIFFIVSLFNLSHLPYYIEEYNIKQSLGISNCSCCPMCEIESILTLVVSCGIAICLMNRKTLLEIYNWKRSHSLELVTLILIIYLLNGIIFK